jgi:ubiquinone/menaquinone biosynthesis C-methylase UbiE
MSVHEPAVGSWRDVVSRYLDPRPGMVLLDIGAGAGNYARAFADWFGIDVLAVEPAEHMRAEMSHHARVRVLDARGDELPLAPGSADGAWISRVIHHFPDIDAVAAELHRTLRPGAPVMLREIFAGRWQGSTLLRAFPRARGVTARYPSVEQVCTAFTTAGFEQVALEPVEQWVAPDIDAFIATLRRYGDGLLRILSDDEYEEGLSRLRSSAPRQPVSDGIDLLVFRRAPATSPGPGSRRDEHN